MSLKNEEEGSWADGGSGESAHTCHQRAKSTKGVISPTRSLVKCFFLNSHVDVQDLRPHPLKHMAFSRHDWNKIILWEHLDGEKVTSLKDLLCFQVNWKAAQGEGNSFRTTQYSLIFNDPS